MKLYRVFLTTGTVFYVSAPSAAEIREVAEEIGKGAMLDVIEEVRAMSIEQFKNRL